MTPNATSIYEHHNWGAATKAIAKPAGKPSRKNAAAKKGQAT